MGIHQVDRAIFSLPDHNISSWSESNKKWKRQSFVYCDSKALWGKMAVCYISLYN